MDIIMNSKLSQQPVFCLMVSTEWEKNYDRWSLVNIFSDEDLANDWSNDLNNLEQEKTGVESKLIKIYKVQERIIDGEVDTSIIGN
jgi:hypothetical protein